MATTEALKDAIELLAEKINGKLKEVSDLKKMVNMLAREQGMEPVYVEEDLTVAAGSGSIRSDQYYGKSPTTAAREYIESRQRAVPIEEVCSALEKGGFDFSSQGWQSENRVRNLAISLSKNSGIFHKLPNNTWGLVKFYPDLKKKKVQPSAPEETEPSVEEDPGAGL